MEARLTQLKELLGIAGTEEDGRLAFALAVTEDQILAYIRQERLPPGLERVLVLMAAGYWKGAGLGESRPPAGAVSAVRRGDVSTAFAAAAGAESAAATFGTGSGDGFYGWRTALTPYRRMRWRP